MLEELNLRHEYFEKLDGWIKQTKLLQNAAISFPHYLASNYPNYFALNGGNRVSECEKSKYVQGSPGQESSRLSSFVNNRVSEQINGCEFVIAPLWKRLVAEMVDIVLLLLLKVAITFTILNLFDLNYEFEAGYMQSSDGDPKFLTLSDLLTLSSDLVALEILMKIFVCLYETFWTMNGRVGVGGATPGKYLLRLRIVHVEVLSISNTDPAFNSAGLPLRALIYPAGNPGFRRAFLRAIAKNFALTLLFPICFVFLFLKNNRTFYDILTKTVVVEESRLRRQNA